jgi:adenylate kinase family enzyme
MCEIVPGCTLAPVSAIEVSQVPRDAMRISLRGCSGSGKSTLGRAVAAAYGLPFVELDAHFHQADWTPLEDEAFRERVAATAGGDGWVIDGNYGHVLRDLVESRADTIVLYDLPRSTVMARIVRRTLRRAVTREELWNGNREQPRNLFRRDPHRSIILWSWSMHGTYHERTEELRRNPPSPGARLLTIRSLDDERLVYGGLALEPAGAR